MTKPPSSVSNGREEVCHQQPTYLYQLLGSQLPNSKRFCCGKSARQSGAPKGRAGMPWHTATDPGGALDTPFVADMRYALWF